LDIGVETTMTRSEFLKLCGATAAAMWLGPRLDAAEDVRLKSWELAETPSFDLGAEQTVGGVNVSWSKAYARDYRIEVSSDGQSWKEVFHQPKKSEFCGNTDLINFTPVQARHVRLFCTKPGTDWGGYTVYEFGVYAALPQ
jgi:hypothetical protein